MTYAERALANRIREGWRSPESELVLLLLQEIDLLRGDRDHAVECLRRLGEISGCDHADGHDDRARLVRCIEEAFEAAREHSHAAQEEAR